MIRSCLVKLAVKLLESMHRDLELLSEWSKTWGLEFNVDKCKVIHFGRDNPNSVYAINDKTVKVVPEDKDLGVIVNQDLKVANQCAVAVKAANRTLGLIKRTFLVEVKIQSLYCTNHKFVLILSTACVYGSHTIGKTLIF